ncbi:MAG: zf-HC2 domain-containing protein [Gemmatimonadota bacterium]|nr:MAG: zf-HC2 domain-containing protein [Gemmatimonadota bacterium]
MTGFIRDIMEKMMPQPGGIDCGGVMAQLYEYLDGELDDPALQEKIRAHLEKCRRCYPRYNFEKAFLRFVSDRGHTSAPPELRRKIFQTLLEEEGHD